MTERQPRPSPAEELVAPFLLGPFRLLDKVFSGGRVTAAFDLEAPPAKAEALPPPDRDQQRAAGARSADSGGFSPSGRR